MGPSDGIGSVVFDAMPQMSPSSCVGSVNNAWSKAVCRAVNDTGTHAVVGVADESCVGRRSRCRVTDRNVRHGRRRQGGQSVVGQYAVNRLSICSQ